MCAARHQCQCYDVSDGHIGLPPHCRFSIHIPSTFCGVKIALVQLAVGKDKTKNIQAAIKEVYKAKKHGVELIVLPECFSSPHGSANFGEYAEEIPHGETCQALSKTAKDAGICIVGGTILERSGDSLYNTCTVWDEWGDLIAKHRQVHLFDVNIPKKVTFKESDFLSAGHSITTFQCCGLKIGLGICYDLLFPEMAYVMAKEDCSLLIYPGNFSMTAGLKHCELLARARATDLQLWVALVSPARNTKQDYIACGHSMLVNPWGEVVKQLQKKPDTLFADIDLGVMNDVRKQIPIRKQRRCDLYDINSKKQTMPPA